MVFLRSPEYVGRSALAPNGHLAEPEAVHRPLASGLSPSHRRGPIRLQGEFLTQARQPCVHTLCLYLRERHPVHPRIGGGEPIGVRTSRSSTSTRWGQDAQMVPSAFPAKSGLSSDKFSALVYNLSPQELDELIKVATGRKNEELASAKATFLDDVKADQRIRLLPAPEVEFPQPARERWRVYLMHTNRERRLRARLLRYGVAVSQMAGKCWKTVALVGQELQTRPDR